MTTAYKIDVFNACTGEFDRGAASIIRTHTLGFVRCSRSDNFIVTFCNPAFPPRSGSYRQQIVVLPGAFYRIMPDINRDAIAGTISHVGLAGSGWSGCVDYLQWQSAESF